MKQSKSWYLIPAQSGSPRRTSWLHSSPSRQLHTGPQLCMQDPYLNFCIHFFHSTCRTWCQESGVFSHQHKILCLRMGQPHRKTCENWMSQTKMQVELVSMSIHRQIPLLFQKLCLQQVITCTLHGQGSLFVAKAEQAKSTLLLVYCMCSKCSLCKPLGCHHSCPTLLQDLQKKLSFLLFLRQGGQHQQFYIYRNCSSGGRMQLRH
mmetsp:Transcript_10482/g.64165  ORF Transcript_10482/g.64165 Transcript_10482/m.64165 type:complete len:206 (+) Transcript_10482:1897-2514(+)